MKVESLWHENYLNIGLIQAYKTRTFKTPCVDVNEHLLLAYYVVSKGSDRFEVKRYTLKVPPTVYSYFKKMCDRQLFLIEELAKVAQVMDHYGIAPHGLVPANYFR